MQVLVAAPKDARAYFEYPESTNAIVQKVGGCKTSRAIQLVQNNQGGNGKEPPVPMRFSQSVFAQNYASSCFVHFLAKAAMAHWLKECADTN